VSPVHTKKREGGIVRRGQRIFKNELERERESPRTRERASERG